MSPRHSDDNIDRVDDNDNDGDNDDDNDDEDVDYDEFEIKELFPFLLSYVDLSTLELKEKVPNRLPLPLLLREEYKVISELIKERPQNGGGSVIVSGQPGTGELLISIFTQDLTSLGDIKVKPRISILG